MQSILIITRYEELLANVYSAETSSVQYRDMLSSAIFVYQMLLGDVDPSAFLSFKQLESGSYTFLFLWIVYIFASISIVLVLMNIIIAIMGEVQGQRGEKGRAVVYSTQAKLVLEQYPMFVDLVGKTSGTKGPNNSKDIRRYLTIAYERYE